MGICHGKGDLATVRHADPVWKKQILRASETRGPVSPCNVERSRGVALAQQAIKSPRISQGMYVIEKQGNIKDHYDVDKKPLGIGAFGSVCKARHKKTQAYCAIKAISKKYAKGMCDVRQEIAVMKMLDHPNIIKLHEIFEDRRNTYLVMELCLGGELFGRIFKSGRFSEVHAAVIMQQILRAVFYMHNQDICHRDLKPENFLFLGNELIEKDVLKLIDFGLSCKCGSGDSLTTRAGTAHYVAPEVLTGRYDKACDLWSCGAIMFILLCGYPPFHGASDTEVLKKVRRGKFNFKFVDWNCVTDDAKDLIRLLLRIDPRERLTAEPALNHTWINGTAPKADIDKSLPNGFVENLRDFESANLFKKAALHVIAGRMSEKQIQSLRETFTALDSDGDGLLTTTEVRVGLKKSGLIDIPADLHELVSQMDSNNSGAIDYTEFLAASLSNKLYMQEDVCWKAFSVFDQNGDGMICKEELKKVLQDSSVEHELGMECTDVLMKEVDTNGDGAIDFDEFMSMMRKKL